MQQLTGFGQVIPFGSVELDASRFARARVSYLARDVGRLRDYSAQGYHLVQDSGLAPRAGDVALVRVESADRHARLELTSGRRARLSRADELVVAYGRGYDQDRYEGDVPADLGSAALLAPCGLVGRVVSMHDRAPAPTMLEPLGLLADEHGVITLARCSPYQIRTSRSAVASRRPAILAVSGSSVQPGKVATVAAIVRGLGEAGLGVVVGRVNGTSAARVTERYREAGALRVLDVASFGHASTYGLPRDAVLGLFAAMVSELSDRGPDVIVLELCDGLFQREMRRLVAEPVFAEYVDGVVLAAGDAMSAFAGATSLTALGLPLVAISGKLAWSPLAGREVAAMVDHPVRSSRDLTDPHAAVSLLSGHAARLAAERSSEGRSRGSAPASSVSARTTAGQRPLPRFPGCAS